MAQVTDLSGSSAEFNQSAAAISYDRLLIAGSSA